MSEVFNLAAYRESKSLGIPIKELEEYREKMSQLVDEVQTDIDDEYLELADDIGLPDYRYIQSSDVWSKSQMKCNHEKWKVVEEGYQAKCSHCNLNAWSATW